MEPLTVLIVEDEPSINEMLQTLLGEEGYKVVAAANGQEGLERLAELVAAENKTDAAKNGGSLNLLILTDVMMPVMDGRQMLKKIRSTPAYEGIPVIIMSAVSSFASISELGRHVFLGKPFEIDILLKTIHQASAGFGD